MGSFFFEHQSDGMLFFKIKLIESSVFGFCRQHYLQCTQGLLNKHYERLIQCDRRLNLVSQQPDLVLDSPYFDIQAAAKGSPTSSFNDVESTSAAECSSKIGPNSAGLVPERLSLQAPSPSSGTKLNSIFVSNSLGLKFFKCYICG